MIFVRMVVVRCVRMNRKITIHHASCCDDHKAETDNERHAKRGIGGIKRGERHRVPAVMETVWLIFMRMTR